MYPIFLALRYARTRAVTYLALLTVAISVASFVVVMSVLSGFRHEVEMTIQQTGAPLEVYCSATYGIADADREALRLQTLEGVRGTSPYFQTMALIRTARFRTLGVIQGIDLDKELAHGNLAEFLKADIPVENIDGLESSNAGHSLKQAPRSFSVPQHLVTRRVDQGTLEPWEDPSNPEQQGTVPIWPQPDGDRKTVGRDADEGLIPRQSRSSSSRPLGPLPRGVIVGAKRARRLGLYPGDEMIMAVQGLGETLRVRSFTVIGFYESGTDWLNDLILVDRRAAQDLAGEMDATGISIWLENNREMLAVRDRVRSVFREDRYTKVRTWRESRPEVFGMMDMQDRVMMIILLIFFVMTGAFIMAILVVLVAEKTRDIGTIRALGATRLGVVLTFISQGLALGIVGATLGLGGGWLLAENVNGVVKSLDSVMLWLGTGEVFGSISRALFDMKRLPVHYDPVHMISMVVTTVAISLLASLLPALRAALLNPVEALRHE